MPPAFLRGFGQVALRQSDDYGLLGERSFADCQGAIRFNAPIVHQQPDWPRPFVLAPWFRRLYFDGYSAGRIELGFRLHLEDEEALVALGYSPIDPALLAQTVREAEVTVRMLDGSSISGSLARSGEALALAYVLGTTRNNALNEFPASETVGDWVRVSTPIILLRLENSLAVRPGRNARILVDAEDDCVFMTTSSNGARKNDVIVQLSPTTSMAELPRERARRVIFSHLNALIHAYAHMVDRADAFSPGTQRKELQASVARSLAQFSSYQSADPNSRTDSLFRDAIQHFATVHSGRIAELTGELQSLGDALAKPSATTKIYESGKAIMQLILTTSVKAAVDGTMKGVR